MRKTGTTDYYGRARVISKNGDPSETLQSEAHLADITNIMRKFGQSGQQMLDETKLQFKDVSEFTDFHDVMNQVKEAEHEFLELPSKVREIFDHDVGVWLDTAYDDDKRAKLVAAGYIKSVADSETPPVEGGKDELKTPEKKEGESAGAE